MPKSSFLDKVLGRIGRLDPSGLQTVVQRLARERDFLEMLFNTIEDGVLVVDENGRILYLNQAVTNLLGIQPDGAEGQPLSKYLPELDWKGLAGGDAAGGARILRQEFEISYPRPRFLRLYAAALDADREGSSGMALIFHDATEARQRTMEAIESERSQALTLLAGSVAHEIGNPLNALHIHLQLMERELRKLKTMHWQGREPPKGRAEPEPLRGEGLEIAGRLDRYLEVCRGEIGRLDYIITQFLHAIRPSQPQFKSVALNAIAEETLELLRPELENRGQSIEAKLAPRLPLARMDPVQIKQVLVNLIKNAMQAMRKNGILRVGTGTGSGGIWIRISDSGGGIAPEQITRIFEPFFTTKKRGSGLGLMIVQRIVRAHGGRIEVESHAGHGTTFRIWLPLHERQTRLLEARLND